MKTILVIDDEESIRVLLSEAIEDWGYRCIEASRAMDGIKLLDKEKIDLLLLDIQMPRMNGIDTVKIIREMKNDIPIFIMTAFTNLESEIKKSGIVIDAFISKPFDLEELGQMIYNKIGM